MHLLHCVKRPARQAAHIGDNRNPTSLQKCLSTAVCLYNNCAVCMTSRYDDVLPWLCLVFCFFKIAEM